MIVNRNLAQSIKSTRKKDIIFGTLALANMVLACLNFILLKNSFYDLIYLTELILVNYMFVHVFFGEYLNLKDFKYVQVMGFLLKAVVSDERGRENDNLEEIILRQSRYPVPTMSLWNTKIKVAFHNYCCESIDFASFIFAALMMLQLILYRSTTLLILFQALLLLGVIFIDSLLLLIAIFIEMPRRIKQYFKLKQLEKRAGKRQLNLSIQLDEVNNNSEENYNIQNNWIQQEAVNIGEQDLEIQEPQRQQPQILIEQQVQQNKQPLVVEKKIPDQKQKKQKVQKLNKQKKKKGKKNQIADPENQLEKQLLQHHNEQMNIGNEEFLSIVEEQPANQQDQLNLNRIDPLQQESFTSRKSKNMDEIECSFCCLAILEDHQKTILKCHPSHIYHTQCFQGWINRCLDSNLPAACMICRQELS